MPTDTTGRLLTAESLQALLDARGVRRVADRAHRKLRRLLAAELTR